MLYIYIYIYKRCSRRCIGSSKIQCNRFGLAVGLLLYVKVTKVTSHDTNLRYILFIFFFPSIYVIYIYIYKRCSRRCIGSSKIQCNRFGLAVGLLLYVKVKLSRTILFFFQVYMLYIYIIYINDAPGGALGQVRSNVTGLG